MTKKKNIFEFTEVGDDLSGIKITKGKYKGLHWTFGTVSFNEEPDSDGNLACHFDYVLHDNPKNLEEDQTLLDFMGDILIEVLDQELKVDDHIDTIDIPLPPESGMVKQLIDSKTATDYLRENIDELVQENNDND